MIKAFSGKISLHVSIVHVFPERAADNCFNFHSSVDAEVVPVIIKLLAGLWDLAYADVASLDMTTAHLIPHIMDHLIVTIQNMSYFDKKFALKCCEHDLLPHLKAWLTNLLFIFITKSTTLVSILELDYMNDYIIRIFLKSHQLIP